jgi:flagellar hook-basal body complex protein FliE
MSVSGIEGVGFTPYVAPQAAATGPTGPAGATGPNTDFGKLVADGLDKLEGTQKTADGLALQAATGDLQSIHDYTIAATQAQVTTQVTVAVRNKAVEAFTEIMRMPV